MTSFLQFIAYGFAGILIAISFLNPGGYILAGIGAGIIILVGWAGPFAKEFVLNATKGRWDGRQRHDRNGGENR